MIKQAIVENWRSHRKTIVEFAKTITAIGGDSDSGKSAFCAALGQLFSNRPLGDRHVADIMAPSRVVFTVEDDQEVERGRYKGKSGKAYYKLSGFEDPFEALQGQVPPEVSSLLNMASVNTQGQLERHFMLQMKASEAGRILSELGGLEDMFALVDEITSIQNEARRLTKAAEDEIKRLDPKIERLDPVPALLLRAEKLRAAFEEIETLHEEADELEYWQEEVSELQQALLPEKHIESLEVACADVALVLGELKQAEAAETIVKGLAALREQKQRSDEAVSEAEMILHNAKVDLNTAWVEAGNCDRCGQKLTKKAIEHLVESA